jgi:hypothetical protein
VKPKSSALRALLDEIKSDPSSPTSSKSPTKMNFNLQKVGLLDNSNNSSEFNYKSQADNIKTQRNLSTTSNNSKDLNFKDMKSEITSIQEKIDGLEKKLCKGSN